MFRLSISGILSTMPFLDVCGNSWCRFILHWSHWVRTYESVNLSAMWLLAFAKHAKWKRFTDTQRNAKAYLSLILSMFSILQLINNIHFSTQTKNDLVHFFHLYKMCSAWDCHPYGWSPVSISVCTKVFIRGFTHMWLFDAWFKCMYLDDVFCPIVLGYIQIQAELEPWCVSPPLRFCHMI